MWKCDCGANNEEESLACINCGQERGAREEEFFVEPPSVTPPRPRERAYAESARERVLEEEVYVPPKEEFYVEEVAGPSVKKVLRIVVVSIMSVAIIAISLYAFIQIGGIREADFFNYVRQCIGIWIRCIILTQAVLIIGLLLIFLLRESTKPARP